MMITGIMMAGSAFRRAVRNWARVGGGSCG